jgi:hypothetical protein
MTRKCGYNHLRESHSLLYSNIWKPSTCVGRPCRCLPVGCLHRRVGRDNSLCTYNDEVQCHSRTSDEWTHANALPLRLSKKLHLNPGSRGPSNSFGSNLSSSRSFSIPAAFLLTFSRSSRSFAFASGSSFDSDAFFLTMDACA